MAPETRTPGPPSSLFCQTLPSLINTPGASWEKPCIRPLISRAAWCWVFWCDSFCLALLWSRKESPEQWDYRSLSGQWCFIRSMWSMWTRGAGTQCTDRCWETWVFCDQHLVTSISYCLGLKSNRWHLCIRASIEYNSRTTLARGHAHIRAKYNPCILRTQTFGWDRFSHGLNSMAGTLPGFSVGDIMPSNSFPITTYT